MLEKIKEIMKPKCAVCGKRINTKRCKEGIGGGFEEAICYGCLKKRMI
jgi:hypothetical protein